MNRARCLTAPAALALAAVFVLCTSPHPAVADPSTAEDRAALFDYILDRTLEREAWSPVKNRILGLDAEKAMRALRDEVVAADTDEKLFYALVKLSNARKDRHLSVRPVPEGLELGEMTVTHAPIRFAVDFGTPGEHFLFVADRAKEIGQHVGEDIPEVGDKLVAVNETAFDAYRATVEPYYRYSTTDGFWYKLAQGVPERSRLLPPHLYRDGLVLGLERPGGERYSVTLPYLAPDSIAWEGFGEQRYPGFSEIFETPTYDLHQSDDQPVLVLEWHRFTASLIEDVDRLMAYASENDLLDHSLIFDGTRSGGGSKGAYAVQRLSPKAFKTTFGNLRLSDVIPLFIEEKREQYAKKKLLDGDATETVDDGTWLMEWLEDDVTKGLHDGQAYSNNVPFKLAHLPKHSDGIIEPAEVHFRGNMVCLFGPHGGSHLDQFAAIIVDNDLGHTIGMPTGGYSNTWEWDEVLRFPISGQPVVRFMWNIGHTIRPNGQILEGEAAQVEQYIPVTRDNYLEYYPILLSEALKHLGHE